MTLQLHSTRSSYREAVIEHLFVGDLLRASWRHGTTFIEVLKPQVDDAGYDLLLEANGWARHVQLKASFHGARTASQKVHLALERKPGGCVVWVQFDPLSLELGPFLWFGSRPGHKLPSLTSFKVAKHTKGDATGRKAERPNIRVVPKSKFDQLASVDELLERLFGEVRQSTGRGRHN